MGLGELHLQKTGDSTYLIHVRWASIVQSQEDREDWLQSLFTAAVQGVWHSEVCVLSPNFSLFFCTYDEDPLIEFIKFIGILTTRCPLQPEASNIAGR